MGPDGPTFPSGPKLHSVKESDYEILIATVVVEHTWQN